MKLRILFVDKDEYLLNVHRKYFERDGYQVDCAITETDAMAMIFRNQYAAIVCDLHLDNNGSDERGLLFASKARTLRPGAAFFIMTSRVSDDFERNARSRGVYMCLTKPQTLHSIKIALEFAIVPDPLGSIPKQLQPSGQEPFMYFGEPSPLNRSPVVPQSA